eukprot:326081-Prymnesium_polylepis.1
MSKSDTINQHQEREEKVKQMDSMCVMVKGKQTYLGTHSASVDRSLSRGRPHHQPRGARGG